MRRARRVRGDERRVLQVRPLQPRERQPVGQAQTRPRVDTTADSSSSKFSRGCSARAAGMSARPRAARSARAAAPSGSDPPTPAGRRLSSSRQHDVRVANDPEQMGASNAHAREQLAEIEPRPRPRATRTCRRRRPDIAAGIGMKRGRTSGTFTRANFVVALILDHDREALAAVRDIGKGMAAIERQGRQHAG